MLWHKSWWRCSMQSSSTGDHEHLQQISWPLIQQLLRFFIHTHIISDTWQTLPCNMYLHIMISIFMVREHLRWEKDQTTGFKCFLLKTLSESERKKWIFFITIPLLLLKYLVTAAWDRSEREWRTSSKAPWVKFVGSYSAHGVHVSKHRPAALIFHRTSLRCVCVCVCVCVRMLKLCTECVKAKAFNTFPWHYWRLRRPFSSVSPPTPSCPAANECLINNTHTHTHTHTQSCNQTHWIYIFSS